MRRIVFISIVFCVIMSSCINEEEKQEILSIINSTGESSSSSSSESVADISGGGSSGGGRVGRPDHELFVPDDWKEPLPPRSNPDSYPWEDDRNTPDLDLSVPSNSHESGLEYDDGERGDTWNLPEWDIPNSLPMKDDDFNIPEMPDISTAP